MPPGDDAVLGDAEDVRVPWSPFGTPKKAADWEPRRRPGARTTTP
jgi:hypothetical protein